MPDQITATEACARYGFSRRTFARYVSGGLKPVAVRASDQAKLYEPGAIERAVRATPRGPRRKFDDRPVRVLASPLPSDAPEAQSESAEAIQPAIPATPKELDRIIAEASPDGLVDMLHRMQTAERACYARWGAAIRDAQAGRGEWSQAQIATMHKSWRDSQEMVRRLEKELPEILYRKARYVDAVAIGETLARAGAIVASELDQLGQAIAERCVGRDVREIRTVIDAAVAKARGALVAELEKLTKGAKA